MQLSMNPAISRCKMHVTRRKLLNRSKVQQGSISFNLAPPANLPGRLLESRFIRIVSSRLRPCPLLERVRKRMLTDEGHDGEMRYTRSTASISCAGVK